MTDHFSLNKIHQEKENKESQPVRVMNAYARLSRFNVDIVHRQNSDDAFIAADKLASAIPLSRDTEYDEDEDIIDRGFCSAIDLQDHEQDQYHEIYSTLEELPYSYHHIRTLQEADPEIQRKLI